MDNRWYFDRRARFNGKTLVSSLPSAVRSDSLKSLSSIFQYTLASEVYPEPYFFNPPYTEN
jgi:hypothetical protein